MNSGTYYRDGVERDWSTVFADLWAQYIGASMPVAVPLAERMERLQESIRQCLRMETESFLDGRATAGRVAETKGHAVLLGKIRRTLEN